MMRAEQHRRRVPTECCPVERCQDSFTVYCCVILTLWELELAAQDCLILLHLVVASWTADPSGHRPAADVVTMWQP